MKLKKKKKKKKKKEIVYFILGQTPMGLLYFKKITITWTELGFIAWTTPVLV